MRVSHLCVAILLFPYLSLASVETAESSKTRRRSVAYSYFDLTRSDSEWGNALKAGYRCYLRDEHSGKFSVRRVRNVRLMGKAPYRFVHAERERTVGGDRTLLKGIRTSIQNLQDDSAEYMDADYFNRELKEILLRIPHIDPVPLSASALYCGSIGKDLSTFQKIGENPQFDISADVSGIDRGQMVLRACGKKKCKPTKVLPALRTPFFLHLSGSWHWDL